MSTLSEDCKNLAALAEKSAECKKAHDEAKAAYEEAEAALLERMEHEDVPTIGVGTTLFTRAETIYGQVQDEAAFLEWAKGHDEELFETKARKGLVNELVRERLDNGEELPPGVGFYPKTYISKKAR